VAANVQNGKTEEGDSISICCGRIFVQPESSQSSTIQTTTAFSTEFDRASGQTESKSAGLESRDSTSTLTLSVHFGIEIKWAISGDRIQGITLSDKKFWGHDKKSVDS
jgi:hypothetical protein